MISAVAVRDLREIGPSDRLCQHLPGFAAMAVLISLTCGISGATIIYPSPSFSATSTLEAIEKERCTYTFAAPAIVRALAMHPTTSQRCLDSLRIVELGGAPIYPEILQLATSRNGLNCERVGCGWGMTESPCPLLAEPWERSMPLPTDFIPVGKPIKGTFAKICAPGSSHPVKSDEVGELHVGGPQIVQGYLNGSNHAFYQEGGIRWIKTGDMARIGNGQIYIIGRYKDIIIRGGHNISPAKIERCLGRVPTVEVQVVGAPDELAGEVPVAVFHLDRSSSESHEAIKQQLRKIALRDLGPSETPHAYVSLPELGLEGFPTTLSGKIQKVKLAETVRNYLKTQKAPNQSSPPPNSIEALLTELWSEVSGAPFASIRPEVSVFTFADSITTMRLSTLVKKQLQKDLTVDDVITHPTIREQAKILRVRSVPSTSYPANARDGPPTAEEMAHCDGDPTRSALTKKLAIPLFEKLNLSWSDVEDVFPAPDTSFIYLNRQRPQTWNQRVIYLVPNSTVETLTEAWKAILIHHSMFRTVAVSTAPAPGSFGDTKHLLFVLRPEQPYWDISITTGLEVNSSEELRTTFLNEWADTLTGPVVRIAFVSIKSMSASAFILIGNHAVYDNLSMDLLFSDLETALQHNLTKENIAQAPGHVPFKRFADLYFEYRTSSEALEAANFHATRLRGIGSLQDSLWPKSCAPGWFKGPDIGWTLANGNPEGQALRTPIDPPEHRHGLDGLTRTAPVATLNAMKEKYGIMPHVILKVAVALFNMQQTGTSAAMFANVEAGRKWPGTIAKDMDLPNPLSIAGPMFQVVLNKISLASEMESVLGVLQRVQEEQSLLTQYAQAPLFLIASQLSAPDSSAFWDALARQGYNWAPGIQSSFNHPDKVPGLVKFNRQALDDIGLAWTCGLRDAATFYVNASYDDCQLGKDEVYKYLGQVLSAGVWLADPENVRKGVDECRFEGVEVSGLIASLE